MKKVTLLIALAALVVFAGCKKEKETNGVVLKASIEQNKGNDRTSLNPTDGAINWTAGDQILVNNGISSVPFTLTDGAGTTDGTFTYNGDYEFGANNVAVYPSTATISGSTVSLTLPETQTFTAAGTFGNGANPMLGTFTNPNDLTFTSLCGGLCISLRSDNAITPITSIEIYSNIWGEKLNGEFEVDCTAANPVLVPTAGNTGTRKVVLDCPTMLTSTPQDFYFVLPVGTLANGVVLRVNVGDNSYNDYYEISTSHNLVVEPNTVKEMNTINIGMVGHAYVDLGLPSGLLWATCNVGADTPEAYGDYFAWGETTTKSTYNWSTYQYCMGDDDMLTKYCNNAIFGYNGFTDNLITLLPEDDAATANWGEGWRMPTQAEFQELLDNTTVTWTQQNGVNGRLLTAANGNSLFLPAAGGRWDDELYDAGDWGDYWSSSLGTDDPSSAWGFYFYSGYYYMNGYYDRYCGFTVRPVREN